MYMKCILKSLLRQHGGAEHAPQTPRTVGRGEKTHIHTHPMHVWREERERKRVRQMFIHAVVFFAFENNFPIYPIILPYVFTASLGTAAASPWLHIRPWYCCKALLVLIATWQY